MGGGTLIVALAPFAAALLAPFVERSLRERAPKATGFILALVPALVFVWFASLAGRVSGGETLLFSVDWVPSLGVRYAMAIDGLSLVFALAITGIGTLVVIYAGAYLAGHPGLGRFFSFIFLFMGAMLGLVLSDDLIAMFVFWELTSITSFLLIGFDHEREAARRAALQALIVTGGGGLLLLGAVVMIANVTGSTSISALISGPGLQQSALYLPILILVLGGAFTKSAQVPLHFWLPNAMEAPTPVSAYLHSATMVKAGLYLVMRLHPALGDTAAWTTILPLFGGATFLTGMVLAVRQTDLKLMLAQTTVASLGLIMMLVGFGTPAAIEAAAAYLVAHALFKGGLFMVAGTIDHEAGTRDIRRLGGLRRHMPLTFAAAACGAMSMAGLPPFLGFIAKEEVYGALAGLPTAAVTAVAVGFVGNALMVTIAAALVIKPFLGREVRAGASDAGASDTGASHGHAGDGHGGHAAAGHVHEGPPGLWLGPVVLALAGLATALLAHATGTLLIGPMAAAIEGPAGAGAAVDLHLVPHSLVPAFALSVLTILAGLILLVRLDLLRAAVDKAVRTIGWGPDRGFDQAVSGLIRLAVAARDLLHGGHLEAYINIAVVAIIAALFAPMIAYGAWPALPWSALWPRGMTIYELAMLAIAVAGLYAVLAAQSRLVAIVSLGIQGFAVAVLFLLFGAPDLSFTQFMVETLSVVILTLVMTRLDLAPSDHRTPMERVRDGALAVLAGTGFGLLLLWVTAGAFDDRLSAFFSAYSRAIAHGRNIVNVIIVDFRGLDTLGEISVVLVTGLAILALVTLKARGAPARRDAREEERA